MAESAATAVRRLIREARFGTLATLEAAGGPYASLVAVATDPAGRPTLLISRLARHTRNIAGDARVSLLISAAGAIDPLNAPRASLIGRIVPAPEAEVRTRYLARHPAAAGYVDFTDFAFHAIHVDEAHLVEGFGRIVDVPGAALLTDWSGAEALAAGADGVIAHMNADHSDAVGLYATVLLGAPEGAWRMVAVDPEGCEISSGELVRRLEFSQRVTDLTAVRQELVALVQKARQGTAA
ncbi:HugZ family pyridoxamine 5'-phosphate oxidase [Xanthobacter versatilis]|uniref:HugZ family pyridoxamine 5'-phosphate oxidase n=1 Tax=Xanthobacter autotrophicus (strain ATCC BAA-1158 / Py2) TaxID=78245 RepID=UPI003728D7FA